MSQRALPNPLGHAPRHALLIRQEPHHNWMAHHRDKPPTILAVCWKYKPVPQIEAAFFVNNFTHEQWRAPSQGAIDGLTFNTNVCSMTTQARNLMLQNPVVVHNDIMDMEILEESEAFDNLIRGDRI